MAQTDHELMAYLTCDKLYELGFRTQAIRDSINAIGSENLVKIPDMPDVIIKLDKEIRSRYPNTNHIIEIIESNTAIAGEILGIVKSPTYQRHVKRAIEIKTISHVVSFIGLKQVYQLAMAAAIKNIPQQNDLFRSIIEHSADVAVACAEIAGYVHGVDIEDAYLFGLFRDCGAIGMAVALNKVYESQWDRMISFPMSGLSMELERLNARHDYVGVIVARKWGFGNAQGDTEIMLAIQEHHNVEELNCFDNEKVKLLVAIGLLAENMVNEINAESYIANEAKVVKDIAVEVLCLSDQTLNSIRAHLISALITG